MINDMKKLQKMVYDKIINDLNNYTYKDVYTNDTHTYWSGSYEFVINKYMFKLTSRYVKDSKYIYYLKNKKILFWIKKEKYIINLDTEYINNIFEIADKLYREKLKINQEIEETKKLIKNNKVYELIIKGE